MKLSWKKALRILVALLLQALDLLDASDPDKVAKLVKSKLHLLEEDGDHCA